MKRITSIFLLTVLLLSLTGCNKEYPTYQNENPSRQEESVKEMSRETAYRRSSGQTAVVDDNGDVYYITFTSVGKIRCGSKESSNLISGFEFGQGIGLYNESLYYQQGGSLYKTNKKGDETVKCVLNYANTVGLNSFLIFDNILYVTVWNYDTERMEYYWSVIEDDKINFDFTLDDSDKFGFDKYSNEKEKVKDAAMNTEYASEVKILDATDEYVYFVAKRFSGRNYLLRYSLEEKKVNIFNVEIVIYQPEYCTITDGWIYYRTREGDSPLEHWRTAEDLSKTEKLVD